MRSLSLILLGFLSCLLGISCVEYTPKPRGYVRIEPTEAVYDTLPIQDSPFRFVVSNAVTIEWTGKEGHEGLNLTYPELGATIYCHYLPVTPATWPIVEAESRSFAIHQLKPAGEISEKAYENPEANVYGSLFLLDGGSASPIQFLLTDSVSQCFRGALYFDCKPNADSLAPAIHYIQQDIIELIQTFEWRK